MAAHNMIDSMMSMGECDDNDGIETTFYSRQLLFLWRELTENLPLEP